MLTTIKVVEHLLYLKDPNRKDYDALAARQHSILTTVIFAPKNFKENEEGDTAGTEDTAEAAQHSKSKWIGCMQEAVRYLEK